MTLTWQGHEIPAERNSWNGYTFGNGVFVLMTEDPWPASTVWTSPDGINWTPNVIPVPDWWDPGMLWAPWGAPAFGNGIFVAVGRFDVATNVATSTDGANWTVGVMPSGAQSVYFGGGVFIAVNNWYAATVTSVQVSTDGVNWTLSTMPDLSPADPFWAHFAYSDGTWVAVADGTTETVATSPDGLNWTVRYTGFLMWWDSLTAGNGLFMLVGMLYGDSVGDRYLMTHNVMTSPDGVTWTVQPQVILNQADYSLARIGFGSGVFVFTFYNDDASLTSKDGAAWTTEGLMPFPDAGWYQTIYGNGVFLVIGSRYDPDQLIAAVGVLGGHNYLRMNQRDDTIGVQRAPRLAGTGVNNPTSRALGKPQRLAQSNTYL